MGINPVFLQPCFFFFTTDNLLTFNQIAALALQYVIPALEVDISTSSQVSQGAVKHVSVFLCHEHMQTCSHDNRTSRGADVPRGPHVLEKPQIMSSPASECYKAASLRGLQDVGGEATLIAAQTAPHTNTHRPTGCCNSSAPTRKEQAALSRELVVATASLRL